MASSDDNLQQSTAAELIVHAVSKHERATTILKVCSRHSNHESCKQSKEALPQITNALLFLTDLSVAFTTKSTDLLITFTAKSIDLLVAFTTKSMITLYQ